MQLFPHPSKPTQLTTQFETALLAEYLANKTNVWNKDFIKKQLLQMTHDKCIYCECKIAEESKYLEVDHFEDKNHFPAKVILWSNLLPSCKRCNGTKSDHNVVANPIVNPSIDNPKDHLRLRCYRFYEATAIGKSTIDVLNLNDNEKLVPVRFMIGNTAMEKLAELLTDVSTFVLNPNDVRGSNKLKKRINALLKQGLKSEEYCSTISTVFNFDANFHQLREQAIQKSIWEANMQTRYDEICRNSFLER